jgi:hypothetical protein
MTLPKGNMTIEKTSRGPRYITYSPKQRGFRAIGKGGCLRLLIIVARHKALHIPLTSIEAKLIIGKRARKLLTYSTIEALDRGFTHRKICQLLRGTYL